MNNPLKIFCFALLIGLIGGMTSIVSSVLCVKNDYVNGSEKAQESPPKTEEVPEDPEEPQNAREATEDPKETPEETTIRRPLKFRKFRVMVEIISEKPRNDDYVRQEVKKLMTLVKSVSDTKNIEVVKIDGITVREDKEHSFDVSLD